MEKRDPLFPEEEWYSHPLFSALRSQYNLLREQATALLTQNNPSPFTQQATQFYLDALAPSHFPFLNPKVIRTTVEECGTNLQRGVQHLIQQTNQSNEQQQPFFLPPLSNTTSFEVGKNVAATPGHVIWETPLFQLIRYSPSQKKTRSRPLLVIPPWINKYYILDLSAHNSFVGWCVEQGLDVYIMSWVNPTEAHADQGLLEYTQAITSAIEKVSSLNKEIPHALGYCVGGLGTLLSLVCNPKSVAGLTLLTTPIDFQHMQPFTGMINQQFIDTLSQSIKMGGGIIHGQWFALLFSLLRPHDMIWKNSIDQYFLGKEAPTLDFLFWNDDSMNVSGKLHTDYLSTFFERNLFMHPPFDFLGKKRSLRSIQCPIFVLNAKKDHIVPYKASFEAAKLFWPQAMCVLADSGHVAGVINPPNKIKYGFTLDGETHSGSWWQHWMTWLQPQMGEWQNAQPTPLADILEEAPGHYVQTASIASRPLWSNLSCPFSNLTLSVPSHVSPPT